MKLWLDDYRPKPPDYDIHVKTAGEAVAALMTGTITEISLDYDLGNDSTNGTGLDVARWIAREAYNGNLPRLKWHIHSDNVAGRYKILRAMQLADRHWTENEMAGA